MWYNVIEEDGILKVDTPIGKIPYEENKKYLDPDYIGVVELQLIKNKVEKEIPTDIKYYICKVGDKMNWNYVRTFEFLKLLYKINKAAFFSTILREVAIELDKRYEDHIKNSEEIYIISLANGHICKMDKKFIRSYNNFAAFRNMEDAKFAAKILRNFLRSMFKSGK